MRTIAITMGEPGGVGPALALEACGLVDAPFRPVFVGDPEVFAEAMTMLGISGRIREVASPDDPCAPEELRVINSGRASGYSRNQPTAEGGAASARAIERAVELALGGKADAIVTAPIAKEALKMAGIGWPGHTEMLAHLCGAQEFAMMLVGGGLRVMLVTIHTPLRSVPGLVTRERVLATLRLAGRACRMLRIDNPRIGVCALNPHAGEGGMFGTEDDEHVAPAIMDAQGEGIGASGPYPADTLFYRAHRGEFDLVVAMYHDQGLGPLKLMGFDSGVNITVGLPIVRTSPDHGTAYDIAWGRGRPSPRSMAEAIAMAINLRPA